VLTAVPALLVDAGALVENVLAFLFGRGLRHQPGRLAAGHLIGRRAGRVIVLVLLAATALLSAGGWCATGRRTRPTSPWSAGRPARSDACCRRPGSATCSTR
jgi:hypothetical protein